MQIGKKWFPLSFSYSAYDGKGLLLYRKQFYCLIHFVLHWNLNFYVYYCIDTVRTAANNYVNISPLSGVLLSIEVEASLKC